MLYLILYYFNRSKGIGANMLKVGSKRRRTKEEMKQANSESSSKIRPNQEQHAEIAALREQLR